VGVASEGTRETTGIPAEVRRFIESAGAALALCDANGNVLFANAPFRALAGETPSLAEHPLLRADPAALARAAAGATVHAGAARIGARVARATLSPYRVRDGAISHVTVSLEDLGVDRGPATLDLGAVLGTLTEGVIAADRRGIVIHTNAAAERLLGVGSAAGAPLDRVLRITTDRGEIADLAARVLAGEECAGGDDHVELVRGDGERLPLAFHAVPLRTRDGVVEGALVVLRDMAETRRRDAELRESQYLLEEAQSVAHIGSWVWDVERDTLVWSKETHRIFGIDESAFDGRVATFNARVHPDDFERVDRAAKDALAGGAKYEVTHRIVRPDGEERWLYEQATVHRSQGGSAVRMIGTAQDITERKDAEEQLLHAQKLEAVGRLAGGIAHDFNNLMSVVLSFADILLAKLDEGDRLRHHVEQIRLAGERAAHLTRQLLAVGRRQMLQPRVVDLGSLVNDMVAMIRRVIGEDITVEVRPSAERLPVYVDPMQIEQAVLNLTLNARDAMPGGGRLTIELAEFDISEEEAHYFQVRAGPYAMLAVSDTGQGMDSATASRAFEPYYTTKKAGTGLGLASVEGIVRQSGGTILLDTERGRGTTFAIYLPKSQAGTGDEAAPVDRASEPPPRAGAERSGTILLVEDDPQVRDAARETLEDAGFTVLAADAPSKALAIARESTGAIDLLLTDVVLPEMSGSKPAAALAFERPSLPVLYMTGYAEDAIVHHGLVHADVELVEKPITPAMLVSRVRARLAR
jgi:two-component system cell cycle sensor histidine kinase/response regulator CckA